MRSVRQLRHLYRMTYQWQQQLPWFYLKTTTTTTTTQGIGAILSWWWNLNAIIWFELYKMLSLRTKNRFFKPFLVKRWRHFERSLFKVGVNHRFFHVYHFWNFLIFKCTWVCSSSSSKNKSIFLNLSINSINLKMSITWVFQKCVHLYFRGEIKLARV